MGTRSTSLSASLDAACQAARDAGKLMKANLHRTKKVNEATLHDIKLDLDVRCQRLITRSLARAVPGVPVLGEEGHDPSIDTAGSRWVIDPIDGTVNFAHGIPHAAVSIALQLRESDGFKTVLGVVHDPFMDDTWTATHNGPARCNGRRIRVSPRRNLDESIISLGFAKSSQSLNHMMPLFSDLVHRVRKIRLMGSAALALTYVADGRFDGYVEAGIRLWDIAAGGLIVERAGGKFDAPVIGKDFRHSLHANNGWIDAELQKRIDAALQLTRSTRRKN
jgi:myo-inositol-1(or 4)-monophosphatase